MDALTKEIVESQSAIRTRVLQQEEIERAQGLIIEVDDVTPAEFLDQGIHLETAMCV